jgi:diaminopimelate decarboxylase
MYDAYHEVIVANKADAPLTTEYTITGPICETGDILAADRRLPQIAAGDIIAVLDTGAYGYAMSSQYNSRPRCPEVLIQGTNVSLMRRGENTGDLTAAMQYPPWQQ